MDQIREFHYSELQNLILCLFQNIFLKQRRCENGLSERKWQPIFIKNVTLEPKENALRMKKVEHQLDRIPDVRHPEKVERRRIGFRV